MASYDSALRAWFREPAGQVVLDQECECLTKMLADVFGYYLVQIGSLGCEPQLAAASRIRNHVVISQSSGSDENVVSAAATRLPVANDAVDAVVLPHTLDFSEDPRQVLREVERILIPEGRLIILGFNPWSLMGAQRWIPGRRKSIPWSGDFLPLRRIQDWLSLLGFDIEETRVLMFRPPLRRKGLMSRMKFVESLGSRWWPVFGGIHAVRAVKRVSTLTPIARRWKSPSRLIGDGVIEPTTRSQNSG